MKGLMVVMTYLTVMLVICMIIIASVEQYYGHRIIWLEILMGFIYIGFPICGPCGWFGIFPWLYKKLEKWL